MGGWQQEAKKKAPGEVMPTRGALRTAGLALLAGVPLLGSGCLVVAAGAAAGGAAAAGYVYFQGKDTREYPAGIEDTWLAIRTALTELNLPIVRAEREGTKGWLESRTADNEVVNVSAEAVPGPTGNAVPLTQVSVRVALLGDHPLSNRLLDQIGYHLIPAGAKGPPATVEPPRWSSATPQPPPPPLETRAPPLAPAGPAGSH